MPRSAEKTRTPIMSNGLLAVLALLAAVAPISTDLYLPSFPQIGSELGVDASAVQLTLTAFLLGVAGGQLLFGPLSDRFGRRGPLVVGSIICVAAAVVAALAPNITVLILARLVQGISGAAGMVIGRAIISDLTIGAASARAFSLMMTIGGVAPVIAPTAGGILAAGMGWRGVLWVIAALTALMLVASLTLVPETRPASVRVPPGTGGTGTGGTGALRAALAAGRFPGYVLLVGCAFATLMAYISASPFLYQSMMGFSPTVFGMFFGLNALGMVTSGYISSRIVRRVAPRRILAVALPILVVMVLIFGIVVVTGAPIRIAVVPIFVTTSSLGFVMGNTTALALAEVRAASGAGSALLGCTQFVFGAVVSPLTGLAGEHSAGPMAAIMCAAAVLALALFVFTGRRGHPAPEGS